MTPQTLSVGKYWKLYRATLNKIIFQGKFEPKNWIMEGEGRDEHKAHTEERILAQRKIMLH